MEEERLSFESILKQKTQSRIEEVRQLQTYMNSEEFYELPREKKTFVYGLMHEILNDLEDFGFQCEQYGIKLDI